MRQNTLNKQAAYSIANLEPKFSLVGMAAILSHHHWEMCEILLFPMKFQKSTNDASPKVSRQRAQWLFLVNLLTFWLLEYFLHHCFGLKSPEIRMAYREKIAICILVFLLSAGLVFFLVAFSPLICPRNQVYSVAEINNFKDPKNPKAFAYGQIYDLTDVIQLHDTGFGIPGYKFSDILGSDVSNLFYKHLNFADYCPGLDNPDADWDSLSGRKVPSYAHDTIDSRSNQGKPYVEFVNRFAIGRVGWSLSYIEKISSPKLKLIVIGANVYDVSAYFNSKVRFLGPNVDNLFLNFYGNLMTNKVKMPLVNGDN